MKEQFFEFDYSMDEEELKKIWKSLETIFVIDTNVFLNLYSYQEVTRNAIYNSISKVEDRLWSPHQVMLEYNKNRNDVIHKSKRNFDFILKHLSNYIEAHKCTSNELKTFDNEYGKIYPELRELFTEFQKDESEIQNRLISELNGKAKIITDKIAEYKQQTISLKGKDTIREKLASFYTDEKIGHPYTKDEIKEIYEEGNQRYTDLIPPGYKDADKTEKYYYRGTFYQSKFGDLVLYKQILKHCKENSITNVIFITEDNKEDWKEKIPHENQSYYGIRREIRAEAFTEANIKNFISLNIKEFIQHSNQNKLEESLVHDLDAVHELYLNYGNEEINSEDIDFDLIDREVLDKVQLLNNINYYESQLRRVSRNMENVDESISILQSEYSTIPNMDESYLFDLDSRVKNLINLRDSLEEERQYLSNIHQYLKDKLNYLNVNRSKINQSKSVKKSLLKKKMNINELKSKDIEFESDWNEYLNSGITRTINNMSVEEKNKIFNLLNEMNTKEFNNHLTSMQSNPSLNEAMNYLRNSKKDDE